MKEKGEPVEVQVLMSFLLLVLFYAYAILLFVPEKSAVVRE